MRTFTGSFLCGRSGGNQEANTRNSLPLATRLAILRIMNRAAAFLRWLREHPDRAEGIAPSIAPSQQERPAPKPHGEIVSVPIAQINSEVELFWRYEFSLDQKQRLAAIREAVADAYPISQDDWEDGFRKDAAPEREIALWEHVAKFYTYFSDKRLPQIEARKELLNFLFACAGGYDSGFAARKTLKHIEPDLAETIHGCYIFDSFSLDDPENYPPDESEPDT